MVGGASSVAIADGYEYDYEPVGKGFAPPPAYSWNGSYAGFNAGWIYSESDARVSAASPGFQFTIDIGLQPTRLTSNGSGFLAGLTLGHNMQFGSSFVAGIESDIAWTDLDYNGTGVNPAVPFLPPQWPGHDRPNDDIHGHEMVWNVASTSRLVGIA